MGNCIVSRSDYKHIGVNFNTKLVDSSVSNWTATDDCWVYTHSYSFKVDGVQCGRSNVGIPLEGVWFPVKKGTSITGLAYESGEKLIAYAFYK